MALNEGLSRTPLRGVLACGGGADAALWPIFKRLFFSWLACFLLFSFNYNCGIDAHFF